MKKSIWVLVLTSILALFAANVYAEEYDYKESEAILTGIGVLNEKSEKTLSTRAGFVEHILTLINKPSAYDDKAESVFSDVKGDSGKLNYAYDIGLIGGSGNMEFRPEDSITSGEAAAILVRALGYEFQIKSYEEYYQTAAGMKIFDKTGVTSIDTPLGYQQVTIMLGNFLECEVIEYKINEGYSSGGEAMSYFLDVYKTRGTVEAYENSNITMRETTVGEGGVMINGEVYYDKTSVNAEDYLGLAVEYYYKETDYEPLLCHIRALNNEVETIESEDIISVSSDFVISYDKGGRTETVNMKKHSDLVIIYNGKRCINVSASDLKLECGTLKFIDNSRDGKYDVLIVNSYKTYIVSGVMHDDEIITDLVSTERIKLSEFGEYEIIKDGMAADIEVLEKYDVLNIAVAKDNSRAKVIVTSEKAEGKITYLSGTEIKIGDYKYVLSKFWNNRNNADGFTVKSDKTNQFLLNLKGEVCYNVTDLKSAKYAVICSWDNALNRAGECIYIKIFDRENEIMTLELADSVKIDGASYKGNKLVSKMTDVMKKTYYGVVPVVYELDGNGDVKSLLTPLGDELNIIVNDQERYYVHEANTWLRDLKYGDFCSGSSTFFCYIPNDPTQYDDFVVKTLQQMGDVSNKKVVAITVGESRIADFVLIKDSGGTPTVGETENLAVVQDKWSGINEDDRRIEILTLFKGGKEIDLYEEENGTFDGIEAGDIIFYSLNAKSELDGIAEAYKKGTYKVYGTPVSAKGRFSGKVYYKENDIIGVSVDGTMDPNNIVYSNFFTKPNIYVVEDDKVSVGTTDDILDYLTYGDDASEIFIQTRYTKVLNVVVYK